MKLLPAKLSIGGPETLDSSLPVITLEEPDRVVAEQHDGVVANARGLVFSEELRPDAGVRTAVIIDLVGLNRQSEGDPLHS